MKITLFAALAAIVALAAACLAALCVKAVCDRRRKGPSGVSVSGFAPVAVGILAAVAVVACFFASHVCCWCGDRFVGDAYPVLYGSADESLCKGGSHCNPLF